MNIATLLIDMQLPFIGELRSGSLDRILPYQLDTLAYCAEHDIPVVVIEYIGEGSTHRELRDVLRMVPRRFRVRKRCNDGFSTMMLERALNRWRIDTLFLMGINAAYCVKATASTALKRGFKIATSADVIAGAREDNHPHDDDIGWYNTEGIVVDHLRDLHRGCPSPLSIARRPPLRLATNP